MKTLHWCIDCAFQERKGFGASLDAILFLFCGGIPTISFIHTTYQIHNYFMLFRHSHGGTGCGSVHNPFWASRASLSKPSSTAFPGAYFRYHQHQPSLTSV